LELKPDTNTVEWLLGDNFLRGYYQVYDMKEERVGLRGSGITEGDIIAVEEFSNSS
jgi:hypothetical protein